MKIILQSHDRFDDIGEFNSETGELHVLPNWDRQSECSEKETAGFFSELPDGPAILFRIGHDLFFTYGGKTHAVTDDVRANVVPVGSKRRFILTGNKGEMASIEYNVPGPEIPPQFDFTATEPEHFDFLLFVKNILENPQRRQFARGFARD
jgi:hypothetical protein